MINRGLNKCRDKLNRGNGSFIHYKTQEAANRVMLHANILKSDADLILPGVRIVGIFKVILKKS